MRIFIADDSDEDVHLVREAFRMIGQEAIFMRVSDGESALRELDPQTNLNFDLILLDYNLPRIDGAQIAGQLKEWKVIEKVPVMMVSSYWRPADRNRLNELGVTYIAERPTGLGALREFARQMVSLAKPKS